MVAPASAPSGIFQKCGALLTFYPCCYATAPRIRCRYEYFPCTSHVLCIKDGLLGAKLYFDWSEFATSYTPNKKCFKCQNCIYLSITLLTLMKTPMARMLAVTPSRPVREAHTPIMVNSCGGGDTDPVRLGGRDALRGDTSSGGVIDMAEIIIKCLFWIAFKEFGQEMHAQDCSVM